MWDPQIPLLTKRYRVLRYDTRGHGQSDVPPGPYSLDDLVRDVRELFLAFGIQRASFMGLSMGGMTGLGLATLHPERIERVICADARADAPKEFKAMWDKRIATIEHGGLEAIVDGIMAMWFTDEWRAGNPDKLERMRRIFLSNDPKGYLACCRALKNLDYLKTLRDAQVPVLYLGGSEDTAATPDTMREMAASTPNAAYLKVAGAAHIANINEPVSFNSAISDFLTL